MKTKKIITFLTIFILIFNVIFTLNINKVQAHDVEIDPKNYITMPLMIYNGSGKISISSLLTETYDLYYQYVDIPTSTMNQMIQKEEEIKKYIADEKPKLEEDAAELSTLREESQNIINDPTKTAEEKENARNTYNTALEAYNARVDVYNAKISEFNQSIKALKPSYVENNWVKTEDGTFNIDTSKYTGEFHFALWAKLVTATATYYDENAYSTTGTKETTISLNKSAATMQVGDTLKLTATTNSTEAVTWESNKKEVATVGTDGTVTAISKGVATITATVGEKKATCVVTVNEKQTTGGTEDEKEDPKDDGNIEWTDFSNAKFELKKEGVSDTLIEISNVTPNSNSYYYLKITSDNTKPTIPENYISELISLNYDAEEKVFRNTYQTDDLAGYVELNQDLYASIIEIRNGIDKNISLYGKKIERYEEPKYSDAFSSTFVSNDADQIVTTFTHGDANERKLQIKIGKITDKNILQKIKNQNVSGFADLLAFAKNNDGIYNQLVNCDDRNGFAIEYNAGVGYDGSLIDLKGLQDGAYYFLYVEADDENGKYISQEAVTLAQASVLNQNWSLFFFGSEDFEWADFGEAQPDTTISKENIPNAGLNTIIWIIAGVALVGVFSYRQYRKNNF